MAIAAIFDIDGVIRDVSGSYRRALADTVEAFTRQFLSVPWRPTAYDIDALKCEGLWNNDWEGSRELIWRAWERQGGDRADLALDFAAIVEFFQQRYRGRGDRPEMWDGYIRDEPLLVQQSYFVALSEADLGWGFFSGATRGSAQFVLERRLQLATPVLYAMEDGPEKPDPTGMLRVVDQLEVRDGCDYDAVAYCGDTVSDMAALLAARDCDPQRQWKAVGVVPPHLWDASERRLEFQQILEQGGADLICDRLTELTPLRLAELFAS